MARRSQIDAHDLPAAPFSIPQVFARDAGSLLWQSLWPLFGLNLALALASGAAVGLGLLLGIAPLLVLTALVAYPAVLALMAAVAGQARARRGSAWQHAGRALRRHGLVWAAMGLFVNAFLYSYLTTSALAASPASGGWLRLLWGGQSLFLVILTAALVYAWPLAASYDQPMQLATRNGLLLAISAPMATAAMLGGVALTGVAFYWLGLAAASFAPLLLAVLLVANCLLQVNLREAEHA